MQVQQDSEKFHILVIGIVIEITVYPFRAYVYFASVPAQTTLKIAYFYFNLIYSVAYRTATFEQNTILIFNRPSTKVIKKTPF